MSNAGFINTQSGPVPSNVPTDFHTSSGDATPNANIINFIDGNNVTISGASNNIMFDVSGTTNHAVLIGNSTGSISSVGPLTNGQLLIGSTGADPVATSLTAGANITITPGPGTLTISAGGGGGGTVTSVSGTANRITSTGGTTPVIDIDVGYIGQNSITTLGTVTTGTWNGTTIDVPHGGTGAVTLTGVLIGNGVGAVTGNVVTNHAVLIGGASNAITSVGPVAAIGNVLMSNGVGNDPGFSTATFPLTTTINEILFSSGTNTVTGLATAIDGVLITSHTGVPSILANSGTAGWVLTANSGAPPSWQAAGGSAGTITGDSGGALSQSANNWTLAGSGSITTAGAGSTLTTQLTGLTNHALLVGAGTTTITKLAVGTTGQFLQANTTADPTWSTATLPSTATGTGKILVADGTNWVASTPTFPNASATSGKIIKSDGTNWVASTETYAAPGTTGNVLTSNGTNWTSAVPTTTTKLSFFVTSTNGNPADGATYRFMCGSTFIAFASASQTTRIYIPIACTLTTVYGSIAVNTILGSTENCTIAIRLNNTSNTNITTTLQLSAATNDFNNTGLSLSLSAGDFIEFICICPTWTTNPTGVRFSGTALMI